MFAIGNKIEKLSSNWERLKVLRNVHCLFVFFLLQKTSTEIFELTFFGWEYVWRTMSIVFTVTWKWIVIQINDFNILFLLTFIVFSLADKLDKIILNDFIVKKTHIVMKIRNRTGSWFILILSMLTNTWVNKALLEFAF